MAAKDPTEATEAGCCDAIIWCPAGETVPMCRHAPRATGADDGEREVADEVAELARGREQHILRAPEEDVIIAVVIRPGPGRRIGRGVDTDSCLFSDATQSW